MFEFFNKSLFTDICLENTFKVTYNNLIPIKTDNKLRTSVEKQGGNLEVTYRFKFNN